jgi:hypothetical protein
MDIMNIKKYIFLGLLGAFLLSSTNSWAFFDRYGKLRTSKTTIKEVYRNWKDYHVYYTGPSIGHPSAILFDPKGDPNTLVNDKWIRVKSQEELSELIGWLGVGIYPALWRVLSPDNRLYGFMYTSSMSHAVIKVVDNKTMWVDDVPLPFIGTGP